jgi:hypothetical protein
MRRHSISKSSPVRIDQIRPAQERRSPRDRPIRRELAEWLAGIQRRGVQRNANVVDEEMLHPVNGDPRQCLIVQACIRLE